MNNIIFMDIIFTIMKLYEQNIAYTLEAKKHLLFYSIMQYPIPSTYEYFLYDIDPHISYYRTITHQYKQTTGRKQIHPITQEYVSFIKKFTTLYASLPFVHAIYLCNSLTFNAVTPDSDIDICIITKPGALRRARARTVLLFFLFGLKRGKVQGKRKKFCLSFYVTQDHQNFYDLLLPQSDIYFSYWLAHLVPLYYQTPQNIYDYNSRIYRLFPYFPKHHCIDIGITPTTGSTRRKRTIEFLRWGRRGKLREYLIKTIRLPIVIYKTKRLWKAGSQIIVNDNILKFHQDIRQRVNMLYHFAQKKK